jgi:beta-glucosidase
MVSQPHLIRFYRVCIAGPAMMLAGMGILHAQTVPHSEATERAKRLVARMTLDEKITQLHGIQDAGHYRMVPGLPRLGIPALFVTNGPAGVGPGGAGSQKPATSLPAPIALAATWNPETSRLYGQLAAEETRATGSNLLESPDINIARVPQGGRVFESYGEDPFLAARMAVAQIEGIQSTGVIANVKHFLANNQETQRGSINEVIGERTLREIYMPAFEASVKEAHVASVMCAYPRVNGAFNCENRPLLHDVLKNEWKFDGFVTSDFGAVHSTEPSVLAGLDLELPTGLYYGEALRHAVDTGRIPVSALDEMLTRRFAKMMELGWFAAKGTVTTIPALEHGAVARRIADESIVLLKNDRDLLPLNRDLIKSVALIGPYAVRQMTGGGGSSHVIPLYSIAPVDGLDAALLSQTKISLLDGNDLASAIAAAKKADIAIVMVGDDEGEDHDHDIVLPDAQNKLIAAVAAANPKTVVVLKTGSAVLMPWLQNVPAVIEAWYPGEEDGNAVADVLLGKVNPSGKLPLTFPARLEDTLAANPDQYPGTNGVVHYSEGLEVGYRAYAAQNTQPLYPFGFGLSYTTFRYSDVAIAISHGSDRAVASFRITNTGQRAGAEVAQLYLSFPAIPEGNEPPRQLKGFKKVFLQPGESKLIQLPLESRDFSYWSEQQHRWTVAHGSFQIAVGGSSKDTPLQDTIILP